MIAYNLKRKEKYQENLRKWINTETQQMKRLLSGICKRSITSHCLRYTAAHISFILGSKQKAQDYLGHKDSKTTDHYLQIPLNETKMKLHNFVAQNQRHVKEFFGKNGIFAEFDVRKKKLRKINKKKIKFVSFCYFYLNQIKFFFN